MEYCKFCHKECKNANSLRNHERLCKQNPDRQIMDWIKHTTRKSVSGTKGKICINNGKEHTYIYVEQQIPIGWERGHVKKPHPQQILITNELEEKYIGKGDSIPEGWHRGKQLKHRKTFPSLFGPAFMSNGYISYYLYDETGNPYIVYEHTLVMEKHIGRKLFSTEVVHHKDRNRTNNSIENLILFKNTSEHSKYHGHNCNCDLLLTEEQNYICKL